MIQDVDFIVDIPAITMELIENGNLNDFLSYRTEPIGKLADVSFLYIQSL